MQVHDPLRGVALRAGDDGAARGRRRGGAVHGVDGARCADAAVRPGSARRPRAAAPRRRSRALRLRAGEATGADICTRTRGRMPSGSPQAPSRRSVPASVQRPWAASGTEQLPPRARLTARSAATQSQVAWWASGATACSRSWRSDRTSRPSAPWPAAGSISSGSNRARMRPSRPRRLRPAAASTMASYWPSSSLRRRVSRLPQRLDDEVGAQRLQQHLPAQAGGAHHGALGEVGEAGMAGRDERVARILALHHAGQLEALGQLHGHVLERMHGHVGAAFLQGDFQFLHEEALAAHLGQGAVEDPVALGGHAEQFDGVAARAQQGLHVLGLPEREAAFARGDDDGRKAGGGGGRGGERDASRCSRPGGRKARQAWRGC